MSQQSHATLDDVLGMADDDQGPPAIETKSRTATPAPAPADPLAALVSALDRQTTEIKGMTRPAPAAPPARVTLPADVRARIQKARAMRELRATSEDHSRRPDGVLAEKQRRINAALDTEDATELARLRRENDTLRRQKARPAGPNGQLLPGLSQKDAAFAAYRKAIDQYMRTGQETFGGLHMRELQARCLKLDEKAFNASVNAEGGYFVQPEHDTGPIERLLASLSPMRGLATIRSISAASFKKNINLRGSGARWVGEQTASTTDATAAYAELEFPAMTLLAEPEASQESLEDAAINVEEMLAEDAQYDFAEAESVGFVSGDGNKKPRGILSYTFVANASWAWGSVGYRATGTDGALNATSPGDAILQLPMDLQAAFRQQGTWLGNRQTIGTVRTIKATDGHYLWSEGDVSKGVPNTLAGYVFNEDEQMPAIASGAHALAFGDWRRAYLIVDRLGFQVFRNPYINPPMIRFHMRKRVGGGVQRFDAFKTLKFSAS